MPRILEIGDRALLVREMPESTTLIWSGKRTDNVPGGKYRLLDGRVLREILSSIEQREYDVIVLHPPEKSPWREMLARRKDARAWWLYALSRRLKSIREIPMVVFDTRDRPDIPVHIFPALARADVYFKRELPIDSERLMPRRVTAKQRKFILHHAERLRPTSIGLDAWKLESMPAQPVPKTSDVFFAGQSHTQHRSETYPQLSALARRGVSVDVPAEPLPREEFYRRCAAAWLVWSPEGSGWDCFRHYEAAACGSVPVMNEPWIRCRDPLQDGVHGWYYGERRSLEEVIVSALADKDRLRRMSEAGRRHVLAHHTHRALCDMILDAASEFKRS